RDLRDRFRLWFAATETLTGAPLRPLAAAEQAGLLSVGEGPLAAQKGRVLRVTVRAENHSEATWPAYAVGPQHRVVVRARWLDPEGKETHGWHASAPLPRDLPPRDAVEFPIDVPTSAVKPGRPLLEIALAQDDHDFAPDQAPSLRLRVEISEAPR